MNVAPITTTQKLYSRTKTVSSSVFKNTDTVQTPEEETNKKTPHLALKLIAGGLALGAAIVAAIKLHKTKPTVDTTEKPLSEIEQIQNLYKEIFKREVNTEQAKDFAQRYKTILDTKYENDKMFCNRLIEELCKDRQTKKPRINLFIENSQKADPLCKDAGMATSPDGSYIDIYAYNYKNTENPIKGYFKSLFHETHHVKQDEIIYRTDTEAFYQKLMEKYINNGNGKGYKMVLEEQNGDKEKTLSIVEERLRDHMRYYWGGFEPFAKGSAEYKEGQRLIQGAKDYKFYGDCKNLEEYKNQIIEKDAYADGENAEKLFDLLKSIKL